MENNDDGLFRSVLEQNWLHLRHVENQRMWFTNIYAIVVAGSLSFIGAQGTGSLRPYFHIIFFLWIFSVLGLLQTLKTNKEIAVLLDEIHAMCALKGLKKHVEFSALRRGVWKIVSIRIIYIVFYSVLMFFFSYLLYTIFFR